MLDVLALTCNSVSDFRITAMAAELNKGDKYRVRVANFVPFWQLAAYDIFVILRPGDSLYPFFIEAQKTGKPIVVDMDDDFYSIPPTNPAYTIIGPGNRPYMVHLKEMLQIATIVTTTTEVVARRLKVTDKNAIIPNYYDANNSSWQNAHFRHKTINIGWCGTTTHRADFSLCENAVKRILTEYPNTKIVIGGDDEIYARFREFPQSQRQFLPFMQYDDYPLMLAQFDILLAPLQDDWFNQAKSDIKLVEAGAVGIPVVVSPISFYKLWPGVVVAEGSDDWYNGIKGLVTDEETRKTFGQWIRDRVLAERSSEVIAKRWIEVLDGLPKD